MGPRDRRVVTLLECELTDWAASESDLDPEASHRLLTQYLGEARRVVIHHGGTPQQIVGTVLTAVFGLPTLHEDDALRAARAAVELRGAAGIRIGIATGEVASGDPATAGSSITGSALQAVARLRAAAPPVRS